MPTDRGLTDLAATLADGQAVDWAALEAELGSDAERALFRQLRVIDCDRGEEHNVGTQLYGESKIRGRLRHCAKSVSRNWC